MADDTKDLFQRPEGTPDGPDFWKLSSIILKNDGAIEAADEEDIPALYEKILSEAGVTHDTIHYVASQRAYRLLGVTTQQEAEEKARIIGALAAMFVDGFTIGTAFRDAE